MPIEILFSEESIHKRITELAEAIIKDYQEDEFIAVGILNGAYMFMADLSRALWRKGAKNFQVDFIGVSSYGAHHQSSKKPVFTKEIAFSVREKHILLVEDIVETGFTLQFVCNSLLERNPASIKIATLLLKRNARKIPINLDYVGFEVDQKVWVEGYGLDSGGVGRGSPEIIRRI